MLLALNSSTDIPYPFTPLMITTFRIKYTSALAVMLAGILMLASCERSQVNDQYIADSLDQFLLENEGARVDTIVTSTGDTTFYVWFDDEDVEIDPEYQAMLDSYDALIRNLEETGRPYRLLIDLELEMMLDLRINDSFALELPDGETIWFDVTASTTDPSDVVRLQGRTRQDAQVMLSASIQRYAIDGVITFSNRNLRYVLKTDENARVSYMIAEEL
jgi:hypothetical protein